MLQHANLRFIIQHSIDSSILFFPFQTQKHAQQRHVKIIHLHGESSEALFSHWSPAPTARKAHRENRHPPIPPPKKITQTHRHSNPQTQNKETVILILPPISPPACAALHAEFEILASVCNTHWLPGLCCASYCMLSLRHMGQ